MPLILLPPSRLLSISDGDTPEVKMGVRLLGIDAPELHFSLGSSPESQDPVFAKLPKLKAYKNLPKALRDYLAPRLEGAGARRKKWSLAAKTALEAIKDKALVIKGTKSKRDIFSALPPAALDRYGGLLTCRARARSLRWGSAAPPQRMLRILLLPALAKSSFALGDLPVPQTPSPAPVRAKRVPGFMGAWLSKEERAGKRAQPTFNLRMLQGG
jgi:hypothetical protein